MEFIDVLEPALTAISMACAGYSWWRSNISEKARNEAVKAAELAESQVDAARRHATAAEGIAASLQGPAFELVFLGGTQDDARLRLLNHTGRPATLEAVEGVDACQCGSMNGSLPHTFEKAADVFYMVAWSGTAPSELVFVVDGSRLVLPVPRPVA